MNSSMSASTEYNMRMVDSKYAENQMRLSEILYLLSSVKCYEVMLDVYERYNDKNYVSSYQSQINRINARLTLLYQANSHRDSDNFEHWNYSDESKAIKKAIKSMSVKGVSEEEIKTKSLADWKWIVEPSVEADDIQPVTYLNYACDKNGSYFNTAGLQVYDKVSIIHKNGKVGLISYTGMNISNIEFSGISYVDRDEKYYKLEGEKYAIIQKHFEVEKVNIEEDFHFLGGQESYLIWVAELNALFDGQRPEYKAKVKYNDVIAASYVSKIKKTSEYDFEAIEDGSYILINNGSPVNNQIYEDAGVYSDEVIPLKLNGKWGYLDEKGSQVLPFEFDSCYENIYCGSVAYNASNGFIVVKKESQYAIYDLEGKLVIDYGTFEAIRPVYEGMAWVKQDGKWGVIGLTQDVQGISVVAPKKTITKIEATVSEKSGARLRSGPGTDYDVIGMLSNNKKITICGITKDWSYIRVNSTYGWVKSDLIIKEIDSISLKSKPDKLNYYVGDTLETKGLKLKVKFVDKTEKEIMNGFTCEPTKFSNTGTQAVTVTYGDKKVTFDVEICKAPSLPKLTNKNVATVLESQLMWYAGFENLIVGELDESDSFLKDNYVFYKSKEYKNKKDFIKELKNNLNISDDDIPLVFNL